MARRKHIGGELSPSAREDAWLRLATDAAIKAARKVVADDGVIPPGTPIGRLSDIEWGWIASSILFGWIRTRAEQAVAENIDTELALRMTAEDPQAWDAGAVVSILPALADMKDIDWDKLVTDWPQDTVVRFLLTAMRLIRRAMIARDLSDHGVTRKASADVIARQANAAAGGPLMTPDELGEFDPAPDHLNDEIEL